MSELVEILGQSQPPLRVETGAMAVILWSGRQPANDVRAPDPALDVG